MIFTKIMIDNLFSFKNFELDLSQRKRLKNSTINYEHLEEREKVLFRKVCVLMGGNASGKTSLGWVLNTIQNFASKSHYDLRNIKNCTYHEHLPVYLKAEFITPHNFYFHELEIILNHGNMEIHYENVFIAKNDSVVSLRKKIEKQKKQLKPEQNNEEIRHKLASNCRCGWYYLFSQSDEKYSIDVNNLNKNILEKILKTFDPSIYQVLELKNKENELNAFQIEFYNKDTAILDLEGKATNIERFSKGTYDALQLCAFISRIVADKTSLLPDTYFLDEKMAFAHSELEQTILNLMISELGRNAQLFYTTHNYDILEMNLPIHSYVFLRKKGEFSECIQPENSFKKNDRKLLNYVKNDFFKTLPDTSKINELLYE